MNAISVAPGPGSRLRSARLRAGLTQVQLSSATRAKQSSISDFERGESESMFALTLHAICKHLGVTVEWVLDGAEGT